MLKKFWRCENNLYLCANNKTSNKEKHKTSFILKTTKWKVCR